MKHVILTGCNNIWHVDKMFDSVSPTRLCSSNRPIAACACVCGCARACLCVSYCEKACVYTDWMFKHTSSGRKAMPAPTMRSALSLSSAEMVACTWAAGEWPHKMWDLPLSRCWYLDLKFLYEQVMDVIRGYEEVGLINRILLKTPR